jgi:hypothetical protein
MKDRSEAILALHSIFRHKEAVLTIIREEFGLKLPQTTSYAQILDTISRRGLERRFCLRVFHSPSFDEGAKLLNLRAVLQAISWGDLRDLGLMLSGNEKHWKINKSSKSTIADSIIRNCSTRQVEKSLFQYIAESGLPPVMQYKKWVVGPMGVTKSVARRSDTDASSWIDFFSRHIDISICRKIGEVAAFVPKVYLGKRDVKNRTIQVLLTHGTDENIIALFNQLLEMQSIRIEAREDYWNLIATPVGIFEKEYQDPTKRLADVLVGNLDESTLRRELELGQHSGADLREQVVAACHRRKPDELLGSLFGMPLLRGIAKGMKLANVDSTTDRELLTEGMLLKMGFEVPKAPHGLISVLRELRANIRNMPTSDIRTLTGIVTDTFVQMEGLLKDIVFFYTYLLSQDELDMESPELDYDVYESALISMSEFLSREFGIKPVTRLTLGELIDLVIRMDKSVSQDKDKKETLTALLGKYRIITQTQGEALKKINASRRRFTHHVGSETSVELCRSTLSAMFDLLTDFTRSHTYPNLVLVTSSITNEYGIKTASGVDEEKTVWMIDSATCDPGHQYMFYSNSLGLAIEPTMVQRVWEPGG